jgi:acetoacetyl-CoA synthetase
LKSYLKKEGNKMAKLLWMPSEERKKEAKVTKFMDFVNKKYNLKLSSYQELYDWSIQYIPEFWEAVWDFCQVKALKKPEKIVDDLSKFPGAKWFIGARLNYSENVLRRKDDHPALIFYGETVKRGKMTYKELYENVAKMAKVLRQLGVERGDRVVGYIPNFMEGIVAMLASCSLGAIWASCGIELGPDAVIDRFSQIEPKVLFTVDGYFYKGKAFDVMSNVKKVVENLPFLQKVIVIPYLKEKPEISPIPKALFYHELLSGEKVDNIEFEYLSADDPHIILFSSGTTGKPKCIVHSLGGTVVVHFKTLCLHYDLSEKDVMLFIASPSWMVWNVQVSALATGGTLVLYDGNPFYPDYGRIWEIIQNEKVTFLGCGAGFILGCIQAGIKPKEKFDLSSLRTIFQSGSILPEEGFEWVYTAVKEDLYFNSGLGGTDVQGGIIEGTPIQPVYAGQMAGPALGFATKVYDEEGKPIFDKPGELVVEKPFPSVPLYFWGDKDGSRFMETYFGMYPNIWRHGDYIIHHSDTGGMTALGRSDNILKPAGVRIGPAEIYNIVEKIEGIEDSVVVGQYYKGDQRIILFVKLKEGLTLTEELKEKIKEELRTKASPRHVPAKILQVPDIPYTFNLKKVESAVWNIVNGRPVTNIGAIINPSCLQYFEKLTQEVLKGD